MRIAALSLTVLFLTACTSRKTDEDCVVFRESCGCDTLCGSEADRRKEERKPQCDIGCFDSGIEPAPTDADCVADGKHCTWAE